MSICLFVFSFAYLSFCLLLSFLIYSFVLFLSFFICLSFFFTSFRKSTPNRKSTTTRFTEHPKSNTKYLPVPYTSAVPAGHAPAPLYRDDGAETDVFNFPPRQRNHIVHFFVTIGDIFHFPIANDTFIDYEDGPTENLKLIFLTADGLTMAPNSWVKFDQHKQVLLLGYLLSQVICN